MNLQISHQGTALSGKIKITGSKSESNRMLILQALYPGISIENLSNSDDSEVLQKALKVNSGTVDIHHAGTAMRFLTAYYASKPGCEVVLTGSERMKERPVELLVKALRDLGASIEYLENEGFPPLKIIGRILEKNSVTVKANISSQYISALMLIAPSLPGGLKITLDGQVTSTPYILMTLDLLKTLGIKGSYQTKTVVIEPQREITPRMVKIESDWSSASYYYSLAAISQSADIH